LKVRHDVLIVVVVVVVVADHLDCSLTQLFLTILYFTLFYCYDYRRSALLYSLIVGWKRAVLSRLASGVVFRGFRAYHVVTSGPVSAFKSFRLWFSSVVFSGTAVHDTTRTLWPNHPISPVFLRVY
jgi:hypothetical protein